ncbi:alpha-glucosidase [Sesbania bispinosa]|nr:alpha-glucosidase [Sesbania bispinosa]
MKKLKKQSERRLLAEDHGAYLAGIKRTWHHIVPHKANHDKAKKEVGTSTIRH